MSNKKIVIPQIIYNQMVENGRSNLPYETCGLLSGIDDYVQSIWHLENEVKSVSRFFVKKETVEETMRKINQLEEQVLAIYHTHPTTAPVPSSYDIFNHPDEKVSMLIISYKTNPPITKWYNIQGSKYVEHLFFIESC
ncbi:Mov34/MPN/PAD-1 family protein [Aquibacillus albus]|uniref:Proteasome lid subunit RPN8/RPN11 n=1 Tax=Aquibacillus albus TaxID=1168171 RepID=A0ABS2N6A0_9BACI|nr:Mov34/MPN/PAD-1 family protein [Aquibacillus albus]MBM7573682.1 proteasome lid subunit RPN8/RPN11 [Aquibacillus albus]